MNFISRMLRGFVVIIAVLLTCISLSANGLFEGDMLSDSFDDCIRLLEAQSKSEQLTREVKMTVERQQAKGRIAEALKNREMKLIDAAAYFCSLHEDPKSWHHADRPCPQPQDGEGWCREVIEWTVQHIFFGPPSHQADALRQRLEEELQKHLKGQGAAGNSAMPAHAARAAAES